MCGIALIVLGVRIDLSAISLDFSSSATTEGKPAVFSVDDLKAGLRRRGPDSLGGKKVFLHLLSTSVAEPRISSLVLEEEDNESGGFGHKANGGTCSLCVSEPVADAELHFIGATLQLRGLNPIIQPLVDSFGNVLIYNGEIFGGIHVDSDSNDAEVLMETLGKCCSCNSHRHPKVCSSSGEERTSVPDVLSAIKGPWAIIYWQDSSRTLWFGRDAFGRRSLLVHWPTKEDSRFLLSSVSPFSSVDQSSDFEVQNAANDLKFWDELPCGINSLSFESSRQDRCLIGEVKRHGWSNPMLLDLIKWERSSVEPTPEELSVSHFLTRQRDSHPRFSNMLSDSEISVWVPAQKLLFVLRNSVVRRSSLHKIFQPAMYDSIQEGSVPVAVLFSGGLDSMILAALLDECLDPHYGIDLLNVSFDGEFAPDRISAKAGVEELQKIAPSRRWKLVNIDVDLTKLTSEMKHIMSLINPANTYMDLNIGTALWLASSGDGWVNEKLSDIVEENHRLVRYKSKARVVLVGSGADEQCAGYGRHKTKFRCGSWLRLHEEMKLDMQRIWRRNMGRDDRCIADHGKEARFPFLDEDVIRTLLDIPLWEIANLDQPSGIGDKKILREVARLLGLHEASVLPKRAIQFGSRIARESNRQNFGSNRAANQASAGSAIVNLPSHRT
ncbi:asparagine synthetase domain-containing protein C4F6.11c isoform X2 [Tripterygium wilfordii]|uniref:asparagine synthetase domain-containing protein C4F6.11c isoform X2 n=1 Tax=Tripterygium wilfordii TaxID=458696 RepID=UPI0018F864D2|nr:asparagine synthetase domain-containing protein C4F6.11c isoform X2 [Tripterygium wilfordii]